MPTKNVVFFFCGLLGALRYKMTKGRTIFFYTGWIWTLGPKLGPMGPFGPNIFVDFFGLCGGPPWPMWDILRNLGPGQNLNFFAQILIHNSPPI